MEKMNKKREKRKMKKKNGKIRKWGNGENRKK